MRAVPLQQAVHLMTALEVLADLLDHAFLRTGEVVRERLVAAVERLAHPGHGQAHGVPAADVFLLQQGKLQVEEFLELKPVSRFGQGILVHGKVDLPEGVTQGNQSLLLEDVLGQRLLQGGEDEVQGRCDEFAHQFSGDAARLEFLRRGIHARQDAGLRVVGGVELGMDHVDAAVEGLRLAEET